VFICENLWQEGFPTSCQNPETHLIAQQLATATSGVVLANWREQKKAVTTFLHD
jgi:hypothetical protein